MAGNNNRYAERDAANAQALMVVQPPRLPMPKEAKEEHGITPGQWKALTDAVFPSATSVDGVMLALRYCDARKLDVFKRVVHVVPMWNSKLGRNVETVWPGIGEMRTTAHRTGQNAGNDDCVFGRTIKQGFKESKKLEARGNNEPKVIQAECPAFEFPEWAQITVYKLVGGQRVPFVGPKVRFLEIFSGVKGLRVPNERWRQAPFQMLEKCAEAAALRRAFPEELGDEWSAEEMEGKEVRGMPTVEAQYHYVSEEEASGEPAAEVVNDDDRDLRGWDPDELADYVRSLKENMPTAPDLAALEHGMSMHATRIESLPDAEAEEIRGVERQVREKLEARSREKEQRDDDQGRDDGTPPAEDDGTPEQDDEPAGDAPTDQEEPPYLRNFRLRVTECADIPALDRLCNAELPTLKKQPAWIYSACDAAFRARRAELEGVAE